jgi:hypothetical protein
MQDPENLEGVCSFRVDHQIFRQYDYFSRAHLSARLVKPWMARELSNP